MLSRRNVQLNYSLHLSIERQWKRVNSETSSICIRFCVVSFWDDRMRLYWIFKLLLTDHPFRYGVLHLAEYCWVSNTCSTYNRDISMSIHIFAGECERRSQRNRHFNIQPLSIRLYNVHFYHICHDDVRSLENCHKNLSRWSSSLKKASFATRSFIMMAHLIDFKIQLNFVQSTVMLSYVRR